MVNKSLPNNQDYQNLLIEIQQRIRSAQYQALKAVNHELIFLYWDIGRLMVDRQRVVVQQQARKIGYLCQ